MAEHRMGIGFADLLAKRHRAQANGRNLQITAAKEDVLHKKNSAKSVKKPSVKAFLDTLLAMATICGGPGAHYR
ncbi:MAG: hypothetical protein LBE58_10615 [Comamonas sp.]|jgi:hypothetical protein|nr:hypothetical protein [Comamonas sp.]